MKYLMIENPGEAPVEGLLLFGASTKDSSDTRTIGMFGSGTKHAVLALLRKNLFPIIYSGTNKLEWRLKPIKVGEADHHEVLVTLNNAAPKPVGCTLGMGKADWKDNSSLALREIVSNALDAVDGNIDSVRFAVTDSPRASKGVTRVYVPFAESLEYFKQWLPKWFLHWRQGIDPYRAGPIPKSDPSGKACFFRRGVLIRQVGDDYPERSLWDYNFTDLQLDESRNSDYYAMMGASARLLAKEPRYMAKTLRNLVQTPSLWESQFSHWELQFSGSMETQRLVIEAIDSEFQNVVFVSSLSEATLCSNLGKQPVIVPQNWGSFLENRSAQSFSKALNEDARNGRDILPATKEMLKYVDKWEAICKANMLFGTPVVAKAFRQHPNSTAGAVMGFTRFGEDGGIFLNIENSGEALELTVIEELAHWHSNQRDFTRGFQEWLIRLTLGIQKQAETGKTLEEEFNAKEAKSKEENTISQEVVSIAQACNKLSGIAPDIFF